MVDPGDVLIGAGGTGGVAIIGVIAWKLFGVSASRNLETLDDTLKTLAGSIAELGRDIRNLRETDVRQAEQIGALQQGQKSLTERVDGQGNFWREEFAKAKRR